MTPAITDFFYYGHQIVVLMVSVIVGVDCPDQTKLVEEINKVKTRSVAGYALKFLLNIMKA